MAMDTPRDQNRDVEAWAKRHQDEDGCLTFFGPEERRSDQSQENLDKRINWICPGSFRSS